MVWGNLGHRVRVCLLWYEGMVAMVRVGYGVRACCWLWCEDMLVMVLGCVGHGVRVMVLENLGHSMRVCLLWYEGMAAMVRGDVGNGVRICWSCFEGVHVGHGVKICWSWCQGHGVRTSWSCRGEI